MTGLISNWLLNGYDDFSPGAYWRANQNENEVILKLMVYLHTIKKMMFYFLE